MQPLIAIVGPTASGKSALALACAERLNGYIISADSRQVYRDMDIGTAKPTAEEQCRVPHFLLDVVNPDEPFTLADYQEQVSKVLEERKNNGLPFLVGGTGLYIDAVLENWEIPKGAPNSESRKEKETAELTELVERLRVLDPVSVETIDLKNKRRVIRALEVVEQTGTSFVEQKKRRPFPFRVLRLGLTCTRDVLNKRIDDRVDDMMRRGLLEETQRLAQTYDWSLPAMSGIGYRQLGQYLRGECSLPEAVERIKIATRQYAKRQMTWLKRNADIQWIGTQEEAEQTVQDFLHDR